MSFILYFFFTFFFFTSHLTLVLEEGLFRLRRIERITTVDTRLAIKGVDLVFMLYDCQMMG